MNIITTQYSLETKSLDIFLAGCRGPHCPGCHNPESWDFEQGAPWHTHMAAIQEKVREFAGLIERIRIMGGEPLDHGRDDLGLLLFYLSRLNVELWLFTGKLPIKVPEYVQGYCDYIKCGRYDEHLLTECNIQHGVKLASANQVIYKKGVDY